MSDDDKTNVVDLEAARAAAYRRKVERRAGLPTLELIELALQAERQGATPEQVRAILDGSKV